MAYQDNNIVRVDCKSEKGVRVCYRNSKGVKNYEIPEGTKEIVYYKEGSCSEYPAELLKKEKSGQPLTPEENKQLQELKGIGPIQINISETEAPSMQYSDITETEMFGFKEISNNALFSPENGLWAYHGLRKLKFDFKNLQEIADDYNIKANLIFDHRENDEMIAISSESEDILMNTKFETETQKNYEFFAYIDTNKLGEKFEGEYANRQKILFSGYIQIEFEADDSLNSVTYVFPVEILVNNTNYEYCKKIQKNVVSIDFGTSSSCVAVRGEDGVELLTLSATEESIKNINIYENPTCVMLYRWDEIYQQWRLDNEDFPLVTRGNLDEHKLNQKSVQYDFGYSVKQSMREVDDQQLNSILTEIKMIPKYLSEGEQESVRPLVVQSKKVVNLVDDYEKQDDENFDVIAFYGYILGKAINRVEKNKIYTRFNVTYPVKFSSEVRKKVQKSLEYGLKRSIPKPLRNCLDQKNKPLFKVDMKYPEPVAYIGSVCGKYLKYDPSPEKYEAKLFGVFDFGGGTLDYSFGVFAKDEDDENSSNIHVLGVDGDSNVGGELLIKKMAYWLYTSTENVNDFVGKQIPFEKPIGEVLPDGCPEELFNSTADAKSNVRKICERFTRDIFQGISDEYNDKEEVKEEPSTSGIMLPGGGAAKTDNSEETDTEGTTKVTRPDGKKKRTVLSKDLSGKILLHDINGNEVEIKVTVDEKAINELLKKVMEQKVSDFKDSMKRTFDNHSDVLKKCGVKYDDKKVIIFEAGNSSRNVILQETMKTAFNGNEILLIDETNDEFMKEKGCKPKKIALTPKTAVAFGQVILSDYNVDDSYIHQGTGDAPFSWFVGNINRGNNSFIMLIDKANVTSEWIKYGRINSEDMKIYFAETPVENADDGKLRDAAVDFIDEDDLHKTLFIRVAGSNTIECCVCEKGKEPDDNIAVSIVELK